MFGGNVNSVTKLLGKTRVNGRLSYFVLRVYTDLGNVLYGRNVNRVTSIAWEDEG